MVLVLYTASNTCSGHDGTLKNPHIAINCGETEIFFLVFNQSLSVLLYALAAFFDPDIGTSMYNRLTNSWHPEPQ